MLEIRDLTKDFGGLKALNSVDFDVHQGELLGIIGPNGSGKTTLFNIISGLMHPTMGNIIYKGESLIGLRPDQVVHRGIGTVFQHKSIFPSLTVKENIIVGRHIKTNRDVLGSFFNSRRHRQERVNLEQKAEEWLEFIGMQERRDVLAMNLPHGDQRKLQIAMALATEPELLLLDEPATGMNPDETGKVMSLMQSLHHIGKTLVIVEHNMRVIMGMCSRIVVFNLGFKMAEGTPREIASNEDIIAVYLGRRRHSA